MEAESSPPEEPGRLVKRRKLYPPPPIPGPGSLERLKGVIFPTAPYTRHSSTNSPSLYGSYQSAPVLNRRQVESKVNESKMSVVNRVVTRLLSRDYLLGMPTSWENSFPDPDDYEACSLPKSISALPMEKLINSE
jgi:hypothetical protein